ncbi:expressed unknown protein [Seminavis robusta]|uniref:Uncharacterized protein n=1 Tax=Seminavis robusta TaxID=568900 RepID=A0A9N8E3G8_9STRA|nr:expressed unknown protein [Seminavis robusta]|eukprot:Sro579_g169960.1 n/a (2498) ;mRNA; r:12384-19877
MSEDSSESTDTPLAPPTRRAPQRTVSAMRRQRLADQSGLSTMSEESDTQDTPLSAPTRRAPPRTMSAMRRQQFADQSGLSTMSEDSAAASTPRAPMRAAPVRAASMGFAPQRKAPLRTVSSLRRQALQQQSVAPIGEDEELDDAPSNPARSAPLRAASMSVAFGMRSCNDAPSLPSRRQEPQRGVPARTISSKVLRVTPERSTSLRRQIPGRSTNSEVTEPEGEVTVLERAGPDRSAPLRAASMNLAAMGRRPPARSVSGMRRQMPGRDGDAANLNGGTAGALGVGGESRSTPLRAASMNLAAMGRRAPPARTVSGMRRHFAPGEPQRGVPARTISSKVLRVTPERTVSGLRRQVPGRPTAQPELEDPGSVTVLERSDDRTQRLAPIRAASMNLSQMRRIASTVNRHEEESSAIQRREPQRGVPDRTISSKALRVTPERSISLRRQAPGRGTPGFADTQGMVTLLQRNLPGQEEGLQPGMPGRSIPLRARSMNMASLRVQRQASNRGLGQMAAMASGGQREGNGGGEVRRQPPQRTSSKALRVTPERTASLRRRPPGRSTDTNEASGEITLLERTEPPPVAKPVAAMSHARPNRTASMTLKNYRRRRSLEADGLNSLMPQQQLNSGLETSSAAIASQPSSTPERRLPGRTTSGMVARGGPMQRQTPSRAQSVSAVAPPRRQLPERTSSSRMRMAPTSADNGMGSRQLPQRTSSSRMRMSPTRAPSNSGLSGMRQLPQRTSSSRQHGVPARQSEPETNNVPRRETSERSTTVESMRPVPKSSMPLVAPTRRGSAVTESSDTDPGRMGVQSVRAPKSGMPAPPTRRGSVATESSEVDTSSARDSSIGGTRVSKSSTQLVPPTRHGSVSSEASNTRLSKPVMQMNAPTRRRSVDSESSGSDHGDKTPVSPAAKAEQHLDSRLSPVARAQQYLDSRITPAARAQQYLEGSETVSDPRNKLSNRATEERRTRRGLDTVDSNSTSSLQMETLKLDAPLDDVMEDSRELIKSSHYISAASYHHILSQDKSGSGDESSTSADGIDDSENDDSSEGDVDSEERAGRSHGSESDLPSLINSDSDDEPVASISQDRPIPKSSGGTSEGDGLLGASKQKEPKNETVMRQENISSKSAKDREQAQTTMAPSRSPERRMRNFGPPRRHASSSSSDGGSNNEAPSRAQSASNEKKIDSKQGPTVLSKPKSTNAGPPRRRYSSSSEEEEAETKPQLPSRDEPKHSDSSSPKRLNRSGSHEEKAAVQTEPAVSGSRTSDAHVPKLSNAGPPKRRYSSSSENEDVETVKNDDKPKSDVVSPAVANAGPPRRRYSSSNSEEEDVEPLEIDDRPKSAPPPVVANAGPPQRRYSSSSSEEEHVENESNPQLPDAPEPKSTNAGPPRRRYSSSSSEEEKTTHDSKLHSPDECEPKDTSRTEKDDQTLQSPDAIKHTHTNAGPPRRRYSSSSDEGEDAEPMEIAKLQSPDATEPIQTIVGPAKPPDSPSTENEEAEPIEDDAQPQSNANPPKFSNAGPPKRRYSSSSEEGEDTEPMENATLQSSDANKSKLTNVGPPKRRYSSSSEEVEDTEPMENATLQLSDANKSKLTNVGPPKRRYSSSSAEGEDAEPMENAKLQSSDANKSKLTNVGPPKRRYSSSSEEQQDSIPSKAEEVSQLDAEKPDVSSAVPEVAAFVETGEFSQPIDVNERKASNAGPPSRRYSSSSAEEEQKATSAGEVSNPPAGSTVVSPKQMRSSAEDGIVAHTDSKMEKVLYDAAATMNFGIPVVEYVDDEDEDASGYGEVVEIVEKVVPGPKLHYSAVTASEVGIGAPRSPSPDKEDPKVTNAGPPQRRRYSSSSDEEAAPMEAKDAIHSHVTKFTVKNVGPPKWPGAQHNNQGEAEGTVERPKVDQKKDNEVKTSAGRDTHQTGDQKEKQHAEIKVPEVSATGRIDNAPINENDKGAIASEFQGGTPSAKSPTPPSMRPTSTEIVPYSAQPVPSFPQKVIVGNAAPPRRRASCSSQGDDVEDVKPNDGWSKKGYSSEVAKEPPRVVPANPATGILKKPNASTGLTTGATVATVASPQGILKKPKPVTTVSTTPETPPGILKKKAGDLKLRLPRRRESVETVSSTAAAATRPGERAGSTSIKTILEESQKGTPESVVGRNARPPTRRESVPIEEEDSHSASESDDESDMPPLDDLMSIRDDESMPPLDDLVSVKDDESMPPLDDLASVKDDESMPPLDDLMSVKDDESMPPLDDLASVRDDESMPPLDDATSVRDDESYFTRDDGLSVKEDDDSMPALDDAMSMMDDGTSVVDDGDSMPPISDVASASVRDDESMLPAFDEKDDDRSKSVSAHDDQDTTTKEEPRGKGSAHGIPPIINTGISKKKRSGNVGVSFEGDSSSSKVPPVIDTTVSLDRVFKPNIVVVDASGEPQSRSTKSSNYTELTVFNPYMASQQDSIQQSSASSQSAQSQTEEANVPNSDESGNDNIPEVEQALGNDDLLANESTSNPVTVFNRWS